MKRLSFVLTQVLYDLEAGLLLRPLLITLAMAVLAIVLPEIEMHRPQVSAWMRDLPFLGGSDVSAAQLMLGTIAGSMMTVLTMTYSILIVALTLISMQFSPRVLVAFLRDRASQLTLGIFIGVFVYCVLMVRIVHGDPNAFVPPLSLATALLLAMLALAWLVYFIHHIGQGIQANFIIDAIATDAEKIIDEVFTEPEGEHHEPEKHLAVPDGLARVPAPTAGYVQLIDEEGLADLARQHGVCIYLHRGPGEFVVVGAPLVSIEPSERLSPELARACADAFDLGPVRTMQQDVEFCVRMLVDIALKAISPAVNDPTTGSNCVDQLGRLLARLATRKDPPQEIRDGEKLLVQLRRTTFHRVVDLAFNQIRQYGKTDMAMNLRMLRALEYVGLVTSSPARKQVLRRQLLLVQKGAEGAFLQEDMGELEARVVAVEKALR